MVPLNVTTTALLLAILFHALMLLYVIGMVLRPLVMTTVTGLIDLARQALGVQRVQTNIAPVPGSDK
jgi:hypothetical protein